MKHRAPADLPPMTTREAYTTHFRALPPVAPPLIIYFTYAAKVLKQ